MTCVFCERIGQMYNKSSTGWAVWESKIKMPTTDLPTTLLLRFLDSVSSFHHWHGNILCLLDTAMVRVYGYGSCVLLKLFTWHSKVSCLLDTVVCKAYSKATTVCVLDTAAVSMLEFTLTVSVYLTWQRFLCNWHNTQQQFVCTWHSSSSYFAYTRNKTARVPLLGNG